MGALVWLEWRVGGLCDSGRCRKTATTSRVVAVVVVVGLRRLCRYGPWRPRSSGTGMGCVQCFLSLLLDSDADLVSLWRWGWGLQVQGGGDEVVSQAVSGLFRQRCCGSDEERATTWPWACGRMVLSRAKIFTDARR
jgi:hypothetical protein